MEDWENFIKHCEKEKPLKQTELTEKGKKLLNKIKISIKNKENDFKTIKQNLDFNSENIVIGKNETLGIDGRSDKKLRLGNYHIDYTLDVHGFTLDEAYLKVRQTFEIAISKNYRCLLIITGKGLHSQSKTIKTSLEEWLKEPFFSNKIIKWTDAQQKDGGTGAVYVLLKKF